MRVEHDLLVQLAAALDDAVSASSHSSSVRIFIGMTAGPLVAKRMRRTFGISSSALPISSTFFGGSWYASPPEMTMSSSSGRSAMYANASSHCLGVLASATFSTSSVSTPIA